MRRWRSWLVYGFLAWLVLEDLAFLPGVLAVGALWWARDEVLA